MANVRSLARWGDCCWIMIRRGGRQAAWQNGGYLALSENSSSTRVGTFERIRKSIRSPLLRSFHYFCKWVVIVIFQAPVTSMMWTALQPPAFLHSPSMDYKAAWNWGRRRARGWKSITGP